MVRLPGLVPVFLLGLLLCGCGRSGRGPADPTGKAKLEEIVHMLQTMRQEKMPPPKDLADLERVEPLLPQAGPELRSGDIVYLWGTTLGAGPEAAATVLAYQKKVPAEGGWVLMQDGTTREMSAGEFAGARKAR